MASARLLAVPFLAAAGLACADPAGPSPPPVTFGAITVSFQGQTLTFTGGADSMIGYYMPGSQLLTLIGTVTAGPTPAGRFFLVLDSLPGTGATGPLRRTAPTLSIAFDHPTDSTLDYPFRSLGSATDQVTLQVFSVAPCEARGTFRAMLHLAGDGPGHEVLGSFWGRFRWNAVSPGPC